MQTDQSAIVLRPLVFFATLLCFTGTVAALDFNFTFDDTAGGGTPGPITGTILGLTDDTPFQPATSLMLTGVGGHTLIESGSLPIDIATDPTWIAPISNSFSVAGGVITTANFHGFSSPGSLEEFHIQSALFGAFASQRKTIFEGETLSDDITFTPATSLAAVPEPSTLSLVVLGMAGVLGCSWRRRSVTSRRASVIT